jgi:hypothetical protein
MDKSEQAPSDKETEHDVGKVGSAFSVCPASQANPIQATSVSQSSDDITQGLLMSVWGRVFQACCEVISDWSKVSRYTSPEHVPGMSTSAANKLPAGRDDTNAELSERGESTRPEVKATLRAADALVEDLQVHTSASRSTINHLTPNSGSIIPEPLHSCPGSARECTGRRPACCRCRPGSWRLRTERQGCRRAARRRRTTCW